MIFKKQTFKDTQSKEVIGNNYSKEYENTLNI